VQAFAGACRGDVQQARALCSASVAIRATHEVV
jgi:hypothetical protein